jgi:LysR family transcriptional regulator, low CO2-responsive transcriptional regulator
MLDLRQLETFLAVIEARSFHEAGRRLGYSQPTVSQHVRKLEEALGTSLIERSPSGCTPTRAAEVLIPFAQSLLRISRRAMSAFSRRRLVVGASGNIGTYMLPDVVSRFERHAEAAPVDILIEPNPSTAEKLETAEVDIALLEWWDDRPGFTAVPWRQEPLVVIVSPAHPWVDRESVPPEALRDAIMLGGEPGTGTGRLLHGALGAAGGQPSQVRQLGSTEAVKRAVRAGLGVSIVMRATVQDEIASGVLRALPLSGVALTKTLYAAYREHPPAGSPVSLFVEVLLGFHAAAVGSGGCPRIQPPNSAMGAGPNQALNL